MVDRIGVVAAIPMLLLSGAHFGLRIFWMPHKHNEDRRHKIPKQKLKVTNWAVYNESLRRRGDLTVWISDDALIQWSAPQRESRGGQRKYSDLAIATEPVCLRGHSLLNRRKLRSASPSSTERSHADARNPFIAKPRREQPNKRGHQRPRSARLLIPVPAPWESVRYEGSIVSAILPARMTIRSLCGRAMT
jgi:hypothetical protein